MNSKQTRKPPLSSVHWGLRLNQEQKGGLRKPTALCLRVGGPCQYSVLLLTAGMWSQNVLALTYHWVPSRHSACESE